MRYPSLTIYTDNLPPDVGGCANGPVVRIRTRYRADTGIHAHEAEHVRLADCPVEITAEYLDHKLDTDESTYGWKDYILFALRPQPWRRDLFRAGV